MEAGSLSLVMARSRKVKEITFLMQPVAHLLNTKVAKQFATSVRIGEL